MPDKPPATLPQLFYLLAKRLFLHRDVHILLSVDEAQAVVPRRFDTTCAPRGCLKAAPTASLPSFSPAPRR